MRRLTSFLLLGVFVRFSSGVWIDVGSRDALRWTCIRLFGDVKSYQALLEAI